jgi:hypothetical protein
VILGIFLVAFVSVMIAVDRGVDSLGRYFDDIDASIRTLHEDVSAMPFPEQGRKCR